MTSLEEARKSWEKETEKSFNTFQGLEEDRLAHVRDSLWRVANISSLAAVADDLAAEEVRKTLEVTDLDEAVQGFISENTTGTQRYVYQEEWASDDFFLILGMQLSWIIDDDWIFSKWAKIPITCFRPKTVVFQQQPTSSSIGMGRASVIDKKQSFDTQSLILGPASTPIPSMDPGKYNINLKKKFVKLICFVPRFLVKIGNQKQFTLPQYGNYGILMPQFFRTFSVKSTFY